MNKLGKFIKKLFIIICVIAITATVVNVSVNYYQKIKLREIIAVVTDEENTIGPEVINQINIYLTEGKKIDTFEEHFLYAVRSAYNGEYEDAENSYISAAECSDDNSEKALACRMAGVMYCEAGSYSKAVEYLEKSLEYEPENTRGLLYLSESYLQKGDYANALKYVNIYADNNDLTYAQIEAVITMYINIDEYESAIKQINKAIDSFPDKKEELILFRLQSNLMGDNYEMGIEDAKEYIELTNADVNEEILVASYYYALEMYKEALDIFLVHIADGENDLLANAVECAYQIDDYETMLTLSKKALQVFEGDEAIEYYKWEAIALLQLGNYREAVSPFDTYIEAYPTHYEIVYLRALCHFALSNYEKAKDDFTVTVEAGTLVEDSLYNRGLCYVQLNDLESALTDFRKIKDDGSGTETYVNAVEILELLELEETTEEVNASEA